MVGLLNSVVFVYLSFGFLNPYKRDHEMQLLFTTFPSVLGSAKLWLSEQKCSHLLLTQCMHNILQNIINFIERFCSFLSKPCHL